MTELDLDSGLALNTSIHPVKGTLMNWDDLAEEKKKEALADPMNVRRVQFR